LLVSTTLLDLPEKRALVFIEDITERKQAEKELQDSEERFRLLSEASFEGIAITDKGVVLDANEQFATMFGYELSEVIGMKALDLVAPESRDMVLRNIKSGHEQPYEHLAMKKDGSILFVEVHGKTIPYEGRNVRVTAIRDITERKQAEEAQRESERMQGVLEMAGAVCHEMNQPLMIILGNAELISMKISNDNPLYEEISDITKQTDRLGKITHKLMGITKYETKDYLQGKIIDIEKSSNDSFIF
jgi:PAS domain S-box-containing protein